LLSKALFGGRICSFSYVWSSVQRCSACASQHSDHPFLLHRFTELHHKHQSKQAAREFVGALSGTLLDEETEDVKKSPFFGIIVDESTDLSTEEHMLVYVVFMKGFAILISEH
jgi:hypothetical protein